VRNKNERYRKLKYFLIVALAAVGWLANGRTLAQTTKPADSQDEKAARAEFIETALSPFWRATEIHEPLFFIQSTHQERPRCGLLFQPKKVLSVRSATRETTFEVGKDFTVKLADAAIELTPGSRIPVTTQEQLYPLMTSNLPKIVRQGGDRTRGIFFGEGAVYHKLQVEVTYRFEPGQWKGPTPKYAGESLPKTVAKLRGKEPVTLMLCGDSI
jgi:acyl-CoA thioesterase-1